MMDWFEQTQRWTDLWMDMASKMMPGMMPPAQDPSAFSPWDASRKMRGAMLQSLAQFTENFMRSPEFLQMMKQSMDTATSFRKQMNDMLTRMRHDTQGVAREDIDSVLLASRHLETRVLDRMDDLAAKLETIERQLGTLKLQLREQAQNDEQRASGNGPVTRRRRRSPAAPVVEAELPETNGASRLNSERISARSGVNNG